MKLVSLARQMAREPHISKPNEQTMTGTQNQECMRKISQPNEKMDLLWAHEYGRMNLSSYCASSLAVASRALEYDSRRVRALSQIKH